MRGPASTGGTPGKLAAILAHKAESSQKSTFRVRPLPKCQGNGAYSADCPKCKWIKFIFIQSVQQNANDGDICWDTLHMHHGT